MILLPLQVDGGSLGEEVAAVKRKGALLVVTIVVSTAVAVGTSVQLAFAACTPVRQATVASAQAGSSLPALGSGVTGDMLLQLPGLSGCTAAEWVRANTNQLFDPANGLGAFVEAGYEVINGAFAPFIETSYPGPTPTLQFYSPPCAMAAGTNFTVRITDTGLSVSPRWWTVQVACSSPGGFFTLPCSLGSTYCAGSYWKANTNGGRGAGEVETRGTAAFFDAHRFMQMQYGTWYNWPNQYCTGPPPAGWRAFRNWSGLTTDFVVTAGSPTC